MLQVFTKAAPIGTVGIAVNTDRAPPREFV